MNVFFILFAVSVFLPTDNALLVLLYWTCAFPILTFLAPNKTAFLHSDRRVHTTFLALLSVTLISTLVSETMVQSLPGFLRYILAYVAYWVARGWSHHGKNMLPTAFTTLGSVIVASYIVLRGISLFTVLPNSSLITSAGHDSISYILVFFAPFFISHLATRDSSSIQTLGLIIATVLSRARNAWIIIAVTAVYMLRVSHPKSLRRHTIAILVGGTSLICGLIILLTPPQSLLLKPINATLRLSYAKQAVRALTTAPLFGHGPGTFELLSRRYTDTPETRVRFAHSFPLELAAETGIIGLTVFSVLLILCIRYGRKEKHSRLLVVSIIASLLYSCFDTGLDNTNIWILFWVSLSLIQPPAPTATTRRAPLGLFISVFLLSAFAVSYTASHILISRYPDAAFYLAPYRKTLLISHIARPDVDRLWIRRAVRWYVHDPDILYQLARVSSSNERLFARALSLDPTNGQFLAAALVSARNTHDTTQIQTILCSLALRATTLQKTYACDMFAHQHVLSFVLSSPHFPPLTVLFRSKEDIATFWYLSALTIYNDTHDAETAIQLLKLARDIAPNLTFFHLELASAYAAWYHDSSAINSVLTLCKENPYTNSGCSHAQNFPGDIASPGAYRKDILNITGTIQP